MAPAARPDPQMPPITFRTEVNYVEVDAVFQDEKGQFVRDLRQDEIQLFENGKPQTISAFSLIDIPVTKPDQPLFTQRAVEADVRGNDSGQGGRVYVILLDDLHTNTMRSVQVRRAARDFVDRYMGANDVAAVVHTGAGGASGQEFTSNKRLLGEAIDRFTGRKIRSEALERIDEYNRMTTMGNKKPETSNDIKDPLDFERAYNARAVLGTINNIAKLLAGVSGRRKALVFFSEGIDYDITDITAKHEATTIITETRDAIAQATRANVAVYGVDPRGVYTYADDSMDLRPPTDAEPSFRLGLTGLMDEHRLSQDSLLTLSEDTGGFAAVNRNDFADVFDRIVRQNSTYYVLGYYPINEKRDGSFRKIEVKVTRPGVVVKARRGYVAPRGKADASKGLQAKSGTSPALIEALNSPLQTSGLPLSVFAAAFRGVAPKATIALVTQAGPVSGMRFAQKDGKYASVVEVSAVAVDTKGKMRGGTRDRVDLTLRPETYQRLQQSGFKILSSFDLEPGRYQLRVAVREDSSGKVGSVFYDLVVPDFAAEPISMSGVVLTSSLSGLVPTAGEIAAIKGMLPAPPTLAREFRSVEQLAVLAEVYDSQVKASHSVDITASLLADDGHVVTKVSETRSSRELGGKAGGYGYTTVLPLKDVAPGLYVLRVEAKSTLEGKTALREVLVRVVR